MPSSRANATANNNEFGIGNSGFAILPTTTQLSI
jgi:hypothetical protein